MLYLSQFGYLLTLIFVLGIQANGVLDVSCSDQQFKCQWNGLSTCRDVKNKCNGVISCDDLADELATSCGNCSAGHLFRCHKNGIDMCLNVRYKCDGLKHCSNLEDELSSECPRCSDNPSMFTCTSDGETVCLKKDKYQCNGKLDCDDGSDEEPSICDNCNKTGLVMCRDRSMCIDLSKKCDGFVDCNDGSDESDPPCNHCRNNNSLHCPGFPENCAVLCDGDVTCPDSWDEMLSVCKSSVVSEKVFTVNPSMKIRSVLIMTL